jgi:acyl-CoA thioesterase FadM
MTSAATVLHARPRYEGGNIRTWIGFKHFYYLVEEAVLEWFRDRGTGARTLFHEYGLGVEVVDCSMQLPAVLEVDDDVRAEVAAGPDGRLSVRLTVRRNGREVVVLRGRVTVALVRERDAVEHRPAPDALRGLEVADLADASTVGTPDNRAVPAGRSAADVLAPEGSPAFLWSWRAPYFYCHFSDRVQHSGYVRALEEVVDRFLADRGLSVARMLADRQWIPVVSRSRVRMVAAAHMEETVHTVLTVEDVLRRSMYQARVDFYVQRDDRLVQVATAGILHGYAISRGPRAGQLAELDDQVIAMLTGAVK